MEDTPSYYERLLVDLIACERVPSTTRLLAHQGGTDDLRYIENQYSTLASITNLRLTDLFGAKLVGWGRFELPTSSMSRRCHNQTRPPTLVIACVLSHPNVSPDAN